MAEQSLRCIAFGYRSYDIEIVPDEDHIDQWVLPEDNLILLGIIGLKVLNMIGVDTCK